MPSIDRLDRRLGESCIDVPRKGDILTCPPAAVLAELLDCLPVFGAEACCSCEVPMLPRGVEPGVPIPCNTRPLPIPPMLLCVVPMPLRVVPMLLAVPMPLLGGEFLESTLPSGPGAALALEDALDAAVDGALTR